MNETAGPALYFRFMVSKFPYTVCFMVSNFSYIAPFTVYSMVEKIESRVINDKKRSCFHSFANMFLTNL